MENRNKPYLLGYFSDVSAAPEAPEKRRERYIREYAELSRMLARDFEEHAPQTVDAVYLPGLTEGMVEACKLFDHVANLIKEGRATYVFYNGSDGRGAHARNNTPGAAWPGAGWYVRELTARGIPKDRLVSTGTGGIHTRAETDELVLLAKARGVTSVAIATVPYHNVRSLSCMIGSMAKAEYVFAAYYATPPSVDWNTNVIGSQGEGERTFLEEAQNEIERVIDYWKEGSATDGAWKESFGAPPEIMREYLALRNDITSNPSS